MRPRFYPVADERPAPTTINPSQYLHDLHEPLPFAIRFASAPVVAAALCRQGTSPEYGDTPEKGRPSGSVKELSRVYQCLAIGKVQGRPARVFSAISESKPTLHLVQSSAPESTNVFRLRSINQARPKLSNAVPEPAPHIARSFKALAFALPTGFVTSVRRDISPIIIPESYVSIVFVTFVFVFTRPLVYMEERSVRELSLTNLVVDRCVFEYCWNRTLERYWFLLQNTLAVTLPSMYDPSARTVIVGGAGA